MKKFRYRDAYYTVEAVFVMSICVWILIALCYGSFYVHDRLLLGSEVNERAADWISSGGENAADWVKKQKTQIQDKMFLFRIQKIQIKKKLAAKKIQVIYTVPISWKNMRKLFTGENGQAEFITERETVHPAGYIWDLRK